MEEILFIESDRDGYEYNIEFGEIIDDVKTTYGKFNFHHNVLLTGTVLFIKLLGQKKNKQLKKLLKKHVDDKEVMSPIEINGVRYAANYIEQIYLIHFDKERENDSIYNGDKTGKKHHKIKKFHNDSKERW